MSYKNVEKIKNKGNSPNIIEGSFVKKDTSLVMSEGNDLAISVLSALHQTTPDEVKFVDGLFILNALQLILPALAYASMAEAINPLFKKADLYTGVQGSFKDFVSKGIRGTGINLKDSDNNLALFDKNTDSQIFVNYFSPKELIPQGNKPSTYMQNLSNKVNGSMFTRKIAKGFKTSAPILLVSEYSNSYTPVLSELYTNMSSMLTGIKNGYRNSGLHVGGDLTVGKIKERKADYLKLLSNIENIFTENVYSFEKSVLGEFPIDFNVLSVLGFTLQDIIVSIYSDTDEEDAQDTVLDSLRLAPSDGGFTEDEDYDEENIVNPNTVNKIVNQVKSMFKTVSLACPPVKTNNNDSPDLLLSRIFALKTGSKTVTNLSVDGTNIILEQLGIKAENMGYSLIERLVLAINNKDKTDTVKEMGFNPAVIKNMTVVSSYAIAKTLLKDEDLIFYKLGCLLARFGSNAQSNSLNVDIDVPNSLIDSIFETSVATTQNGLIATHNFMDNLLATQIIGNPYEDPIVSGTLVDNYHDTEKNIPKISEVLNSPNHMYIDSESQVLYIPENFIDVKGYYESVNEAINAEDIPIATSVLTPFRHPMNNNILGMNKEQTEEYIKPIMEKRDNRTFRTVSRNLLEGKLVFTGNSAKLETLDITDIRPFTNAHALNIFQDGIFKELKGSSVLWQDYRNYLTRAWDIFAVNNGTMEELISDNDLLELVVADKNATQETKEYLLTSAKSMFQRFERDVNYSKFSTEALQTLATITQQILARRITSAKVIHGDDFDSKEVAGDFDYNPLFGVQFDEKIAGELTTDIAMAQWCHLDKNSSLLGLRFIARLMSAVAKILDTKGLKGVMTGSAITSFYCMGFIKAVANIVDTNTGTKEPLLKQVYRAKIEHNVNKDKKENEVKKNPVVKPLAGATPGYSLLPHQARIDGILHNIDEDSYMKDGFANATLLDVKAGGGKTHIIWMDVARKLEDKKIHKPIVVCPDYLIGNYVEDGNYIFEGKYNVVGINTKDVRNFKTVDGVLGLDGIKNIVDTAPRNTLFVCGFNFVSRGIIDTRVIGDSVYEVNTHVEMLLQCGFDYIAADESHELRNRTSRLAQGVSQLFAHIKYRALATGTFMNTRPNDIPNQFGLLDPSTFGSEETFTKRYAQSVNSSGYINTLTDSAKTQVHQQLKTHSFYINAKRKEWAVTLPPRIDRYHVVNLDNDGLHRKLYDIVFTNVIEDVKKILADKGLNDVINDTGDIDEETATKIESALSPYLARLETVLTAPQSDKFFKEVYGDVSEAELAELIGSTPPTKKVIEILEDHLHGMSIEKAIAHNKTVDENSPSYIKLDDNDINNGITKPTGGKILVVCNQIASVHAIYESLPPKLKAQTILYDASNKAKHILEFKKNDKYKILIGVYKSLATGHNFQMASRIIRVDAVWSPGAVEQLESRINRPDPKGTNAKREACYFDWIIVNGTISVTKTARLISRMLLRTMLDEANNPQYDLIEQLPLVSATLDTIQNMCWVANPNSDNETERHVAESLGDNNLFHYLKSKNNVEKIQYREVEDYKVETGGVIEPVEVKTADVPSDYKFLVGQPLIEGSSVPKEDELGLIKYGEYVNDITNNDPNGIEQYDTTGLNVYTSEGTGVIVKVNKDTVRVKTKNGIVTINKMAVFINPRNVDIKDVVSAVGLKAVNVKGNQVSAQPSNSNTKIKTLPPIHEYEEEKPVQDSIKTLPTKTVEKPKNRNKPTPSNDIEENVLDNTANLYVSVINGMPSLSVSLDDPDVVAHAKELKALGFNYNGTYHSVHLDKVLKVNRLIEALENTKLIVDKISMEELYRVQEMFTSKKKQLFSTGMIKSADLRSYLTSKRKPLAPDRVRPIIFIEDGELYCTFDDKDPGSRKFLRKPITGLKFYEYEGYFFKVYTNKKAIVADANAISELFEIGNASEFKADYKALKTTRAKTHHNEEEEE